MRTLKKNKQNMFYALYLEKVPEYEIYTDSNGNSYVIETGKEVAGYSEAKPFSGNIAFSSGEVIEAEFGYDNSGYDATLVVQKGSIPITENSLIWHDSTVKYKDEENKVVDGNSADYKVLAVKPSLNEMKYLLGKVVK